MKAINKKFNSFFIRFWEKSNDFSQFSFMEKIFFFFLVFLEKLYLLGLYVVLFFKRKEIKSKKCHFKVLSVGNLSVGGTGKSVFVSFLIKKLSSTLRGSVIMRGYKSKAEKTGKSFLVSDGSQMFLNSDFSGDEAFMISKKLRVPVVVGANKALSCKLLENAFDNLDYVVLDDAYQNFNLKKDFEVLLLDAACPFENGHCLPAGKLREKDYSRADAIILTHADSINELEIENSIKLLSEKFNRDNIFSGVHVFEGIFLNDYSVIDIDELKNKNVLAFAGIGYFGSFEKSVKDLDFHKVLFKEYPDHYEYRKKDLYEIINYLNLVDIILTTQKDWVKLFPLLKNKERLPIYTLRVGFSFSRENEEKKFFEKLQEEFN